MHHLHSRWRFKVENQYIFHTFNFSSLIIHSYVPLVPYLYWNISVLPVSILPCSIGCKSAGTSVLPCLCTTLSHWFLVCVGLSLYCPFTLVPRLLEPVWFAPSLYCPSLLVTCLLLSLYCPFPLVPHLCWNITVLSLALYCPIPLVPCLLEHVCVAPSLYCPFPLVTSLLPCLHTALSHWFHVCRTMSCPMPLYCPFPLVPRLSDHVLPLYCRYAALPPWFHICWNMLVLPHLAQCLLSLNISRSLIKTPLSN